MIHYSIYTKRTVNNASVYKIKVFLTNNNILVNINNIMASVAKRSWKLRKFKSYCIIGILNIDFAEEFAAHAATVNCVALGHKSGRVMVTGGDDKKVNVWAVGRPSCFMSLSGHTTPVDCVQFNQVEELVCAGSRAGALKVWDLEAAKLIRTLKRSQIQHSMC